MVELIAREQGIADGGSREALDAARAVYGINSTDIPYTPPAQTQDKGEKITTDYREFVKTHCTKEADTSYLQARGISQDTAQRLHFGYDPERRAVVIPITTSAGWQYIERYTDKREDGQRYHIPMGATAGIFNEAVLRQTDPVFITEGAITAASIEEVGGKALAINSVSNAAAFIRRLNEITPQPRHFFICMDNDEAGASAAATLLKGMTELDIACSVYTVDPQHNDANDALRADREAFKASIEQSIKHLDKDVQERIDSHRVGQLLPIFRQYVLDEKNNRPIPTGFDGFDKAIGGGLLPKFYIIGAVTSLGKTTFVLQIADNVAKAGTDVLIFSLEMAKEDIIARSISRHTYQRMSKPGGKLELAKTELGIVMGTRYANYSQQEKDLIAQAYQDYEEYASDHISIYEGRHTAAQIRAITEQYISFTGNTPLVIVDYLQIIQPPEDLKRATVKEQTDANIDVFTEMRRELKTPVIGISAFNRQSYTTVADGSSFKESGNIEYSGDCLMTLELDIEQVDKGTEGTRQNKMRDRIKDAMRANPREIKLTFHKNRGNKVGTTLYYRYNAMFNHFEEDWTKDAQL